MNVKLTQRGLEQLVSTKMHNFWHVQQDRFSADYVENKFQPQDINRNGTMHWTDNIFGALLFHESKLKENIRSVLLFDDSYGENCWCILTDDVWPHEVPECAGGSKKCSKTNH